MSKKKKHHSLIDKIYSPQNLKLAWEKVRANKGSAGIDRISVTNFAENQETYLNELHRQLKTDSYHPSPVKRVMIPKPDGKKRPLGIPTVKDRVAQQAVLNRLEPIWEEIFLDVSFGFRKGRSTHQAMRYIWKQILSGYVWIVDLDIQTFFDTIPQDKIRIRDNSGYFVSRLKQSANPTIVSVLCTHRESTIDLAGKKLKDILPQLKREVLDVEVEVSVKGSASKTRKAKQDGSFEIYHPRGGTPKVKETFRLVGVLNKETRKYHFYLTNISPQQLTAEDVALLYGARWSVELLFKELKSLYQLDVISSGAPAVVESLVLVAMLTLVVSHRLLNHMRLLAPEKSARFTPLRWAESFYAVAPVIMGRVLKAVGIDEDPLQLIIYFMCESIDPNVNRERLLSPWVTAVNSQVLSTSG